MTAGEETGATAGQWTGATAGQWIDSASAGVWRDRPGLAGIMLPKAETVGPIRTVAVALAPLEAGIVLLVETAHGLVLARRLAASSPRVERLAFGALDLALDLGMTVGKEEQEFGAGAVSGGAGVTAGRARSAD